MEPLVALLDEWWGPAAQSSHVVESETASIGVTDDIFPESSSCMSLLLCSASFLPKDARDGSMGQTPVLSTLVRLGCSCTKLDELGGITLSNPGSISSDCRVSLPLG